MSKRRLRLGLALGALSIWAVASPPVLAKPIASEYTSFAGFRLGTVTLAQDPSTSCWTSSCRSVRRNQPALGGQGESRPRTCQSVGCTSA
jgi:hypothetical protein